MSQRRRRLGPWLGQHRAACAHALSRFRTELPATAMTTAAIAIALALPAVFLVVLDNVQATAATLQGTPKLSAFLQRDTTTGARDALADRLRGDAAVGALEVIPADQALAEFRAHSDLDDALELLGENPLPAVLVITPRHGAPAAELDRLADRVGAMTAVRRIRFDRDWVRRLAALMQLAERGVWIVALLLGATVILVVGNTVRLDIENRREEITIAKLIGATDAFVRRPFLYAGLAYGLFGGALACLLVEIGRLLLAGPVNRLAALYNSGFRLAGTGFSGAATIVACGALLALLGAWIAVTRHLEAADPQ